MKVSQAIAELKEIQEKFGDIAITGGNMCDDYPLSNISVTDTHGCEIWPSMHGSGKDGIDGVFFE